MGTRRQTAVEAAVVAAAGQVDEEAAVSAITLASACLPNRKRRARPAIVG